MAKWRVPISITISGDIVVDKKDAATEEEALKKAKELYAKNKQAAISAPCVDVDWAPDIGDIEESEE